jgi:hypothetical protein
MPDQLSPFKNKLLYIILGILLILYFAGGAFQMSPGYRLPTTPLPQQAPPPSQIPMAWSTYHNTPYGYQIDYPTGDGFSEQNMPEYGKTDFLGGCVAVYMVSHNTKSFAIDSASLTDKIISDLELLPQGTAKTYDTPDWGGNKGFTYEVSYQKNVPKIISGTPWSSVLTTNNFENHTEHTIYFTRRNDDLYVISAQSSGPCPEHEPEQVVTSFKFL